MKRLLLTLAVLMIAMPACADSNSDSGPYRIAITRDGKQQTRLIAPFWSGEYPSPVIDVSSRKPGTTTVKGYKSLRDPKEPVNCTIKNGLYHPWAKEKASAANFYSIVAIEEYLSLKQQVLDGTELKKGDLIIDLIYHGEGSCGARVAKNRKEIEFQCDTVQQSAGFKALKQPDNFAEQWLRMKCAEKYDAFVHAAALLKQKGVSRGDITGYGEITGSAR